MLTFLCHYSQRDLCSLMLQGMYARGLTGRDKKPTEKLLVHTLVTQDAKLLMQKKNKQGKGLSKAQKVPQVLHCRHEGHKQEEEVRINPPLKEVLSKHTMSRSNLIKNEGSCCLRSLKKIKLHYPVIVSPFLGSQALLEVTFLGG